WMAYGQITDIVGGGRDVVLKVDGTIVRSQPFQQQYQATLEQYRRQQGGGRLSREDERQVQDRVVDQFIQKILLDRAYGRFGITVSDDEIIQAARSSPPPQILQQVLQDPTFQTNGQFDITKWQRYISSAGPEFASQVEQLYREYLPQRKLEEYLTADLYVSDAKLWRTWRDQHESVTVALLAVHPDQRADRRRHVPPDAGRDQRVRAHPILASPHLGGLRAGRFGTGTSYPRTHSAPGCASGRRGCAHGHAGPPGRGPKHRHPAGQRRPPPQPPARPRAEAHRRGAVDARHLHGTGRERVGLRGPTGRDEPSDRRAAGELRLSAGFARGSGCPAAGEHSCPCARCGAL